jgi:hypothetical protein
VGVVGEEGLSGDLLPIFLILLHWHNINSRIKQENQYFKPTKALWEVGTNQKLRTCPNNYSIIYLKSFNMFALFWAVLGMIVSIKVRVML